MSVNSYEFEGSYGILFMSKSPSFCPVTQMKKILLMIFTLYLATDQVMAEIDLYAGKVVVASQSEADRDAAVPEALIQVLKKLSGRREMPFSPALDEALADASRLLLSFRYENIERAGPDGASTQELRLVARFMPTEVDRIDNGGNRKLKPVEFEYAWGTMEDLSATRGLPVSWPELDEEEAQLIDMRLVWGGFTDYLVERGAPSDGVVIIAARREGPQWTLRWNLASGDRHWSWRSSDQELLFALAEGVHKMTDEIAAINTIAASDQGQSTLEVTISELNSADDYVSCLAYLQNLSLITDVEILGAEPGRVHFRLQLNASSEHLNEAFNRGSVLIPVRSPGKYEYEYLR